MDLSPHVQRRTVISRRMIDAPIGAVFDAYVNPDIVVRWWGPHGFTLTTESIDVVEGGHWRFVFTGPDGKTYKNHIRFQRIEPPRRFVIDHLSGPIYQGTVTFDDHSGQTQVTMYWTFENVDVFTKIKDVVVAGNEGNFDRLSAIVTAHREGHT